LHDDDLDPGLRIVEPVERAPSWNSITRARAVSLRASSSLWGSSMMITSPPSPVASPPIPVAIRYPVAVFSYRLIRFTSPLSSSPGHRSRYQGERSRSRLLTASRSARPAL
jgi:hypothetical protein